MNAGRLGYISCLPVPMSEKSLWKSESKMKWTPSSVCSKR